MTLYTALWASRHWEDTIDPEPPYREKIFTGAQGVPIFGWVAIPKNARGTIVGTYGITGSLENQWFLRLLGRKAFAQGYAVVLFDWRAHGKTALLSPTLTSDGLYEGEDFVQIAAQAKAMGCPAKFWFTGFSLGGQLALWAVKAVNERSEVRDRRSGKMPRSADSIQEEQSLTCLTFEDIGGAAVICPSLDSNRSLSYLVKDPLGKYLEQAIAQELKRLAWRVYEAHPDAIDSAAIERANSIWGFDNELVIERLGFPSVEAYYEASSGLKILPSLNKPTLIIYAADDPMFDPAIVPDLKTACDRNSDIDLILTPRGGHVGYFSSKKCQAQAGDPDPWWAWNRVLEWCQIRG
ncbi:YheT family hydrolase [Gloeocapsopsis dulcis]|uniref:Esterase n=1 Tax=Gloeocapsopsis dulcis AAB1 = 1H9 TaxID=1433147 RepID=A0A6N8FWR2_9CHRO|nr:alpha/beta fold hydrolase [Gloeocapsopsis dulcis]MUL36386.1 esterase [Gloeocapsopsis dulcis AAB1 = 1H9]WNN88119.1 alpha/beta fold hydrolase [Gloeocapsopsis dulcis]